MCCYGNVKHFFLLKFCTEASLIISKNTSKVYKDGLRNNVTVTSLLSWMTPFRISAVSRLCCLENMNNQIFLKLATKVQLSISDKVQNRVEIDWQ